MTWAVSNYLFTINCAGRELTEGLTALLACVVLPYVGFWLHDKTHAKRWREFVDGRILTALQGRSLWVLTFIAFVAVCREVFETVLFYQTLWLQAEAGGGLSIGLISFPSFDLLGIYPTLETLGAQLAVIVVVGLIFLRGRIHDRQEASGLA